MIAKSLAITFLSVFLLLGISTAAAFEMDFDLKYLRTGDYESMFTAAIEHLSPEAQANPSNVNVRFALAVLYFDKEKYSEAKEQLEEIIKIRPNHADSLFYLGMLYRREGNSKMFVEYMNRTVNADPKYVEAYNRLATYYKIASEFEKAEQIWTEALSRVGPEESLYVNLANHHWSHLKEGKGKLDAVINNLQAAIKLRSREQSFFLLGLAYWTRNEYEASREAMQKALEKNPKNINALLVIADTYKETNDIEKAMEFAQKAKAIKPNHKETEIYIEELKEYRKRM